MARLPKPVLAAVVAVVWVGSLFIPSAVSDNGDVQGGLVIAFTIVAGAAAGTWWILPAPWLVAVVLLAADSLSPCDDCRDELGLLGSAFLMALAAVAADILLAIGIGLRKGAALLRRMRAGTA